MIEAIMAWMAVADYEEDEYEQEADDYEEERNKQ